MQTEAQARIAELRSIAESLGYELRADGRWRRITDRDFVVSRGLSDEELRAAISKLVGGKT